MGMFSSTQKILDKRLKSLPSNPFIVWPNTDTKPFNLTQYIRPSLLLASEQMYTLNNEHMTPGIYQIDIYGQPDRGVQQVYTIADEIKDYFQDETEMTDDTTRVLIQGIRMGPSLIEDAWFRVFLEINFLTFN